MPSGCMEVDTGAANPVRLRLSRRLARELMGQLLEGELDLVIVPAPQHRIDECVALHRQNAGRC